MNEKKAVSTPLLILDLVIIAIGIAGNLFVAFNTEATILMKISAVLSCLALCSSLLYAFKGYGKAAAKYFKLFMFLFAMAQLASTFSTVYSSPSNSLFAVAFPLLTYSPILVLALVEDLGKKRSFAVCGFVVAVFLIAAILSLVSMSKTGTVGLFFAIRSASTVLLALIMSFMIYAKYKDKEARGTK